MKTATTCDVERMRRSTLWRAMSMTTAERDLGIFAVYVKQRMEMGGAELSIDELFDQ